MRILIAGLPEQAINYKNALEHLGASCTVSCRLSDAADADALLLPGGDDIDPSLFGSRNCGSRTIDPELDRRQLALLKLFYRAGQPVLGICKGMQLINVYFGGDILQDLGPGNPHEYRNGDRIHPTAAKKGSLLRRLYGERFPTNSAHHQAVGRAGSELEIIQTAPDQTAEGLVHRFAPVIGVQWHPERMCFSFAREDTADGSLLLRYFLSLCR